jgi:hypothetical protein
MTGPTFGEHMVFVDESGDHSLAALDPGFPIFALVFVIVRKLDYVRALVPAIKEFKFRFWGHDCVVLHAYEMRKPRGEFAFLQVAPVREAFMDALNDLIASLEMTIVAVVIRKDRLRQRYAKPYSPYDIALGLGLERVQRFLLDRGQAGRLTHVIAEARGAKEDDDLELEFRRLMDGRGALGSKIGQVPFELRFEPKKANLEGMQVADLVAHPVARHVLKPEQLNRAFDILRPKLMHDVAGFAGGTGLKVFP